jgi:putative redox protein
MSEGQTQVVVADNGGAPYSQSVTIGRHVLTADEPPSRGGRDSGPSPYEYLLAGLGACTAITLRMYAERHSWPLRHTEVKLRHEKVVLPDATSATDLFHRVIHLDGDLTEEQRARLFQVAERCPVSETLRHVAVIDTKLADALSPGPA